MDENRFYYGKYGSTKREESRLDKFMRWLLRVPDTAVRPIEETFDAESLNINLELSTEKVRESITEEYRKSIANQVRISRRYRIIRLVFATGLLLIMVGLALFLVIFPPKDWWINLVVTLATSIASVATIWALGLVQRSETKAFEDLHAMQVMYLGLLKASALHDEESSATAIDLQPQEIMHKN